MVRYGIRDLYATVGLRGSNHQQLQVECQCCFTRYDPKDTVACPSMHSFCRECMQRYVASQLGEQKPDIVCMHGSGCKVPFHPSTLQRVLPPKVFKLYERLNQQKELREANIPNLEFCPRCDFAMIMEVGPESVPMFRCLNLEEGCGKVTCRTCKRDSHWPRTCREEEVRCMGPGHAVEEAMSEALMRRCPGCQRPSIKENGCNHIVCPDCRIHFCYHCRRDITREGYAHFHRNVEHNPQTSAGANGKCLLWDEDRLEAQHAREVQSARERATAQQVDEAHRAAQSANHRLRADLAVPDAVRGISISAPQHRQRVLAPNPAQPQPPVRQLAEPGLLAQQGQALFQRLLGVPFSPAQPPAAFARDAQAQHHPVPPPAAVPQPDAEIGEPEEVIDLAALGRAVTDADHELKLARRRESYARKQWGMRHHLWSEARYQDVVRATEEYVRELREAERRLQDGRRAKEEQDARARQHRPLHAAAAPNRPRQNIGVAVPEPMDVDPQEDAGQAQLVQVPLVDVNELRAEVRRAQHELKKARGRESYARKQWDARHRLWSQERYDGVVRETERYYQLVVDADRRLREGVRGRA